MMKQARCPICNKLVGFVEDNVKDLKFISMLCPNRPHERSELPKLKEKDK